MQSILTVTTPREALTLVSLDVLKAELQITTSDTDDYLGGLLDRVSSTVEEFCNRVFAVETVSERFLSNQRSTRLFRGGVAPLQLSRWPVVSVTSVTENDVLLVENTDYIVDQSTGQLTRLGDDGVPRSWMPLSIVISYVAGFATIPGPIQQSVFELVKLNQGARTRDPALRGENILGGLYSYTLFSPSTDDPGGVPPIVANLLGNYRVPVIA